MANTDSAGGAARAAGDDINTISSSYRIEEKPFYLPIKDEVEIFERAWIEQIPVLLKGPTGCGKTRFVEYMTWHLGQKVYRAAGAGPFAHGVGTLYTVSCHDDLTAADLTGRYLLQGGRDRWVDGPLTRPCARAASATSTRWSRRARTSPWSCTRSPTIAVSCPSSAPASLEAPTELHAGCLLQPRLPAASASPSSPPPSQRFVAIDFSYPPADKETTIVQTESGIDHALAEKLVLLGNDIRNITTIDLEEGVSTRSLVHAGKLIRRGIRAKRACSLAIAQAVTDEKDEIAAIELIVDKIFR